MRRTPAQRVAHLGEAAWSPAALNPVVWLDPSDLSTMFQERTGASATTPSVVDGVVGSMRNKGTLRGWFTAPTDAARPILRRSASGKYYLETDGIDDQLVGDPIFTNLTLAGPGISSCAAVKYLTAGDGAIWAKSSVAQPADRAALIRLASSGGLLAFIADGAGGALSKSVVDVSVNLRVITSIVDMSSAYCRLRIDGITQAPDATSAAKSFGASTRRFIVGAYNDATDTGALFFINGNIYSLVWDKTAWPDALTATIEAYMQRIIA